MHSDENTLREFLFPVGDGHELYVQEWGNPGAKTPFLFLHGGPGSGCDDGNKAYFEPTRDRVIFFDQRGCGRSTPYGSLDHNTTQDLVGDITKILDECNVEQVTIVGGSWGSTLALAYALANPSRVKAMVLRGIFTGSQSEIDFLDKGRFRHIFPDVWHEFELSVPKAHRNDPAAYHQSRLLGDDEVAMKKSAFAYSKLEGSIARLDDRVVPQSQEDFDPYPMRMEVYYTNNRCFMPDRYLLDNGGTLTMPVWIIQGRYDTVCPPITAYELHQQLPNSQVTWTVAGHSGSDRANHDATRLAVSSAAGVDIPIS